MAARRCSQCNANWANTDANKECPACGTSTWIVNPDMPDKTYYEEQEARKRREAWATTDELPAVEVAGTQRVTGDVLRDHRVERYLELGFELEDASLLASAKDKLGFGLYWAEVKRALDAGCSHHHAVLIFA